MNLTAWPDHLDGSRGWGFGCQHGCFLLLRFRFLSRTLLVCHVNYGDLNGLSVSPIRKLIFPTRFILVPWIHSGRRGPRGKRVGGQPYLVQNRSELVGHEICLTSWDRHLENQSLSHRAGLIGVILIQWRVHRCVKYISIKYCWKALIVPFLHLRDENNEAWENGALGRLFRDRQDKIPNVPNVRFSSFSISRTRHDVAEGESEDTGLRFSRLWNRVTNTCPCPYPVTGRSRQYWWKEKISR